MDALTLHEAQQIPVDEIPDRIAAAHERCSDAVRNGTLAAIEAGNLLLAAKSKVLHGEWGAWITANCPFKVRMAQGYIRLAKRIPTMPNAQRVAHLPLRDAMKALSDATKHSKEIMVSASDGRDGQPGMVWSRDDDSAQIAHVTHVASDEPPPPTAVHVTVAPVEPDRPATFFAEAVVDESEGDDGGRVIHAVAEFVNDEITEYHELLMRLSAGSAETQTRACECVEPGELKRLRRAIRHLSRVVDRLVADAASPGRGRVRVDPDSVATASNMTTAKLESLAVDRSAQVNESSVRTAPIKRKR